VIDEVSKFVAEEQHRRHHQLRHGADAQDIAEAKLMALGAGAKLAGKSWDDAVSPLRATWIAVVLLAPRHTRAQANATGSMPANPGRPRSADAAGWCRTRRRSRPSELQRCRQIIREWTLRDSRMSVDENGRPRVVIPSPACGEGQGGTPQRRCS